jgi:D-alanyl-D-alanine carboxypeptidase
MMPGQTSSQKVSNELNERNIISNPRRDSSTTMTRRSVFKVFAGAGAAAVAIAVGGPVVLAEHTGHPYTVSANGNVRSGPSTGYAIIGVARPGDTFTLRGQTQNGYAAIVFQGKNGWVLASLVVEAGSTGSDPVISGTAWTTASVNLRSGPSTSNQVLRVVPKGAKIGTSTTVKNGFRYVIYDGQTGWMSDAYIGASNPDNQGGNYKTTTANVNLRAEPSTSAKILTVIPAGKKVQVLHTQAGQFVNVNYGGYQGWVASAYLK